MVVDQHPYFPVFVWAACATDIDRDLAAGISVFMEHGEKCGSEEAFLQELGYRAYYVPGVWDARDFSSDPRLLGYTQPDEPDGHSIPPGQLSLVPGHFVFLTLTAHFAKEFDPLSNNFGKELYPEYAAKANVLGFDLYPLSHMCGHERINLGSMYAAQRDLVALAAGRPTFQWIETNSLEGACGSPVTPATLHAEAWLAIAGGARGLGYFTYSWPDGRPQSFSVADDVAAEMARTNTGIKSLAPVLLASTTRGFSSRKADPVKVGARSYNGRTYVIAVNSYDVPVSWSRGSLPGLANQRVTVVGEGRSLRARGGRLTDAFPPLGVHLYSFAPAR